MIGRVGTKGTLGLGITEPSVTISILIDDRECAAVFQNAAELSEYIKDLVNKGRIAFGFYMNGALSQRDIISRAAAIGAVENLMDSL